ncbi:MAG: SGNH/GDSL hydrolase family protein, partial [Verrucomicrobiota bacterium]
MLKIMSPVRTFLGLIPVSLSLFCLCPADAMAEKVKKKPNPAMTPVEDVEGLPRVLLIGDSISIGYTVAVQELLEGKANVHRPLTNCGPTTNGLAKLGDWLETGGSDKSWDVIHFNWGLHDLKYMGPNGENLADPAAETSQPQVSQEDYRKNLVELVSRLKATGATLIWRNTTPVPEGASGRVVG